MKKLLLSLSFVLAFGSTQAQNVFNFGFDGTVEAMDAAGWSRTNQSTPVTTTVWGNANYPGPAVVNLPTTGGNPFQDQAYVNGQMTPVPNGQAGGQNSFALVNFTSTSGVGTISNWLITPTITVQNGDVVSFYTRIGKFGAAAYADNLQLRMSTNGDFTTNPTGGATGLGDFTTLLAEVNPSLDLVSYPTSWGQISATISGLTEPTVVKFAFRYYVTGGGPSGNNSDIIGIDTFSVDRTLGTQDFFAANYAVYPNPATDVLNINSKNNMTINDMQITDLNGRVVKSVKGTGVSTSQINISDLNSGVYFLKITSDLGTGTTKVVKN